MRIRSRFLIGVALGGIAGVAIGAWGTAGGLRGMVAGIVSVGLIPLGYAFVSRRQRRASLEEQPTFARAPNELRTASRDT